MGGAGCVGRVGSWVDFGLTLAPRIEAARKKADARTRQPYVLRLLHTMTYRIVGKMKVTAILPDDLVADVRHLARGKTLTDSLRTALEDWTRNKRAVALARGVRKNPLTFTKPARQGTLRELNRR